MLQVLNTGRSGNDERCERIGKKSKSPRVSLQVQKLLRGKHERSIRGKNCLATCSRVRCAKGSPFSDLRSGLLVEAVPCSVLGTANNNYTKWRALTVLQRGRDSVFLKIPKDCKIRRSCGMGRRMRYTVLVAPESCQMEYCNAGNIKS